MKSSDDLADITLSDLEDGWDDDDDKGEEREVVGGDPGEKDLSLDYFGLNDESIGMVVSNSKYSGTPLKEHPGNKGTSILRTLCYVPNMLSNINLPTDMSTPLCIGHFTRSPRCPH